MICYIHKECSKMVKMTLKYRCGVYFIKNALTLTSLRGVHWTPLFLSAMTYFKSLFQKFLCREKILIFIWLQWSVKSLFRVDLRLKMTNMIRLSNEILTDVIAFIVLSKQKTDFQQNIRKWHLTTVLEHTGPIFKKSLRKKYLR